MAEAGEARLRALLRLLAPARSLSSSLKVSLHTETYEGTGDAAVGAYRGLHTTMAGLMEDDPYCASLAIEPASDASDREKVSVAAFAAEQLCAHLHGYLGIGDSGSGSLTIQRGVIYSTVQDISDSALAQLVGSGPESD